MQKLSVFLFCFFLVFTLSAQVPTGPSIAWQRCYGTSYSDHFSDVIKTSDGGFLVTAFYEGTDGDAEGQDSIQNPAILIKFDAEFNIEWQRAFGGTDGGNSFRKIFEEEDGYICFGGTVATTGDFTDNHGDGDYMLVKINKTGNKVWSKCYGSTGYDGLGGFTITQDGGYLMSGYTRYLGGDIPFHYGDAMTDDAILIKTDSAGNVQWVKVLGGSGSDAIVSNPLEISDGISQVHITSFSTDYDLEGSGIADAAKRWIININNDGDIIKENFISAEDDFLRADGQLVKYGDKTIMVGTGNAESILYPPPTGHEGEEGAIAIFDTELNFVNEKQWGGSGDERLSRMIQDSIGNYYFIGASTSTDHDLPGNYNEGMNYDYWIFKTDIDFNLIWSKNFGGSNFDGELAGSPEFIGNIIINNNLLYFFSKCIVPEILPDQDINCGHESVNYTYPYTDAWLVSFDLTTDLVNTEMDNDAICVFPNPTSDNLTILSNTNLENITIQIIDMYGREVFSDFFNQFVTTEIEIKDFASGVYLINLINDTRIFFSSKQIFQP